MSQPSPLGPVGEAHKLALDAQLEQELAPEVAGAARLWRARWYLERGDEEAARADALDALRLLEGAQAGDKAVRAALLCVRLLDRSGRGGRARELLAEVREEARAANARARTALAMAEGELALGGEDPQPAAAHYERAFGLAGEGSEAAADRFRAAQAIGLLAQLRGDTAAAWRWFCVARDTARAHHDPRLLAEAGLPAGMLAYRLERHADARETLAEALDTGEAAAHLAPPAWGVRARLDLDAGDAEAARVHALAAARAGAAVGDASAYADGALLAAVAEISLGRPDRAAAALQAAAQMLRQQGEDRLAALLDAQQRALARAGEGDGIPSTDSEAQPAEKKNG